MLTEEVASVSGDTWERILARLRAALGQDKFEAYLARVKPEHLEENRLWVSVPTEFLQKWVSAHYAEILLETTQIEGLSVTQLTVSKRTAGLAFTLEEPKARVVPEDEPRREKVTWEPPPEKSEGDVPLAMHEQQPFSKQVYDCPRLPHRVYIDDVIKLVCRYYQVSRNDFLSRRKSESILRPRQLGMYLAHKITRRSLPEIGRRFGGRDHTTVLHSVKKIEELMPTDAAMRQELETLRRYLEYGDVELPSQEKIRLSAQVSRGKMIGSSPRDKIKRVQYAH